MITIPEMIGCTFKNESISPNLMKLGINSNTLSLATDKNAYITPHHACSIIERLATRVLGGEAKPHELVDVPKLSIPLWEAMEYSAFLTAGIGIGALSLYFGYKSIKTLAKGEIGDSFAYGLCSMITLYTGYTALQSSVAPSTTYPVNFMLKFVKL